MAALPPPPAAATAAPTTYRQYYQSLHDPSNGAYQYLYEGHHPTTGETAAELLARVVPPPYPLTFTPFRQQRPLCYADVYFDDELMLAQGSSSRLDRLRRTLLHCNDMVFRPNDADDGSTGRRQPVSVKKILKGDACWATYKRVLRWDIDSLRMTMELPPHRKTRLLELLQHVQHKSTIGIKSCQKLLGELRSMVPGIPGGRGLFSCLQLDLTQARHKNCVHISRATSHQLHDFWLLANDLATRPTRIAELIPQFPSFVGTSDAFAVGLGG